MTKEEIIQAIIDDKTMPFIQPEQLAGIVDFVIKNYKPSLPSNLDEAAEKFNCEDAVRMWDYEGKSEGEIVEAAFKAGAEWMAGQGVSWEDKMTYYDGFLIYGQDERAYTVEGDFNEGDEVVVQIRKK